MRAAPFVAVFTSFLCLLASSTPAGAQYGAMLSHTALARQGLVGQWSSQVRLDAARDRILGMSLQAGLVLVHTKTGLVSVFDAETGRLVFSQRFDKVIQPVLPPAANRQYIAIVHGSEITLVDHSGKEIWKKSLPTEIPGGAPVFSDTHLYVPLMRGGMRAFVLDPSNEDDLADWYYQSGGEMAQAPLVSEDRMRERMVGEGDAAQRTLTYLGDGTLVWVSRHGHIYSSAKRTLSMLFRQRFDSLVTAQAVYHSPAVIIGTRDGDVRAVHHRTGSEMWRFAVGAPVVSQPAPVDDRLLVFAQSTGMFALDIKTGAELYWVRGPQHFVAASKTRAYVIDDQRDLQILRLDTGGRVGGLPAKNYPHWVTNLQNDRVYLATATGHIQCLREQAIVEPIAHNVPPISDPIPAAAEEPAEGAQPAAEGEMPAAEPAAEGEMPAAEPAAEAEAEAPGEGAANP